MRFVYLLVSVATYMPEFFIPIAVVSHLPGFFIFVFLRRRRWLVPVGTAAVLFCVVAYAAALRRLNTYEGHFAFVGASFLACGLLAGFLYRSGVLKLLRLQQQGPRAAFAGAVFVLIPALFCGTVYHLFRVNEASRVPTLACASGLHRATLGDMQLALPAAPNLAIETRQGRGPFMYGFHVPEDVTRFCERAATSPPALVSIRMYVRNLGYDRPTWFCAERRDYEWWPIICQPDRARTEPGFSGDIEVFLIERGRNSSYYERPQEELKRIQAGERTLNLAADGFRRYLKADRMRSYVRDDDARYIAECDAQDGKIQSASLRCSVARELASNIGLVYRFYTTDDTFAALARTLDVKAIAYVASLKAPGP